jgi:hypothetical protein
MNKFIQFFIVVILICILVVNILIYTNETSNSDFLDERSEWLILSHAVDALEDVSISNAEKSLIITDGLKAIHSLQRYGVFTANRKLDDHNVYDKLTVFDRTLLNESTESIVDTTKYDRLHDLTLEQLRLELDIGNFK